MASATACIVTLALATEKTLLGQIENLRCVLYRIHCTRGIIFFEKLASPNSCISLNYSILTGLSSPALTSFCWCFHQFLSPLSESTNFDGRHLFDSMKSITAFQLAIHLSSCVILNFSELTLSSATSIPAPRVFPLPFPPHRT